MIEDKFRSIIPQYRRDPITKEIISQPRSEQITVSPVSPMYVTAELIDEYFRVVIRDVNYNHLIEVFNFDDLSEGYFYVNYTSRKIYFDNASIGVKYTIYYNGMGGEFVDASLISTQIDTAGEVVQTLEDILTGDSIGNLNESWGRVTYIQPSDNILQLTRNRRQYVTNGTLLTGTTIKLPVMELGDYLQLTLMFYADSDLSLVFEDENIKFSNQPFIQAGRSYTFSFEYVEGTWYCEWVKLERYLKDYIYKAGDTCNVLTGGYSYSHYTLGTATNTDGKLTLGSNNVYSTKASATTILKIDITNYSKLYIDLDYFKRGSVNLSINIDSKIVYAYSSYTIFTRKIIAIDVSSITGLNNISFNMNGYNGENSTLNIYNAWLEKNEFVDPSQEIFTASEKTKLSSISTGANKVANSTTNGNILIDAVETNIYTHPTGTNPHGTTKANVGLGSVDNTADSTKNVLSATKLTTARTIALTGDVSGSVSFNGSTNATIAATVADDSHNHIINNVDGLQTVLDSKINTTDMVAITSSQITAWLNS